MFRGLVETPKRSSLTVVTLALLLAGAGFLLWRMPEYRVLAVSSRLTWITPGSVRGLALLLVGAAAVVLLLGCLTAFPATLIPPSLLKQGELKLGSVDYITAQNDARSTLVSALAGLLLLVTGILTWRQLVITQEAQVTERYTRAVELLGDDDLAVRVGAIHSLDRLTADSPEDDRSIYTLLTAYIHDHSPRTMPAPAKADESETWAAWRQRRRCEQDHAGYGSLLKCAVDVQAALSVLGTHHDVLSDGRELVPVLTDTLLPGASLGHAQLPRADLRGALLDHLDCRTDDLPFTNLERADFRGASLKMAQFGRANLREARLENADLTGAQLATADLRGAKYNGQTTFPPGFDPVARGMISAVG